jgi:hypothetical protein
VAAALVIGLYGLYLVTCAAPAVTGPDDHGYWLMGRLLAEGHGTSLAIVDEMQYIGPHWLEAAPGRAVCRYPPGLAVLVAFVTRCAGPHATYLINPCLAVLTLLGVYLIGCRLLRPAFCLVPVLAVLVLPTFSRYALFCDAHMAVTACLAWGVYGLILWRESGCRPLYLSLASLALGVIPTLRYADTALIPAFGAFVLMGRKDCRRFLLQSVGALLCALLPVVPLLIYNTVVFGEPWRTGYSLSGEQTAFGFSEFSRHALLYLRWLHSDGLGIFFALGCVGMLVLCLHNHDRPLGVTLVVLVCLHLGLVSSYYWASSHDPVSTMRLLLPTFPLYALAGTCFLEQVSSRQDPAWQKVVVGTVLVLHVAWGGFATIRETQAISAEKHLLAALSARLSGVVRPGDVVVAAPEVLNQLGVEGLCRIADPAFVTDRSTFLWLVESEAAATAAHHPQHSRHTRVAEQYTGLSALQWEAKIAERMRGFAGTHRLFVLSHESLQAYQQRPFWRQEYLVRVASVGGRRQHLLLDALLAMEGREPRGGLLQDPAFVLLEWTWPRRSDEP